MNSHLGKIFCSTRWNDIRTVRRLRAYVMGGNGGCIVWADAVFQGGGIRGIAFVGALQVAEAKGYRWKRVAGTSSGAIVAALLAAGYRAEEMKEILHEMDFAQLMRKTGWMRVPVVGGPLQLLRKYGMYPIEPLEHWLKQKLAEKGIVTFRDVEEERLRVVVTDLTSGEMTVFPDDLSRYGLKPQEVPVARIVAMSCAIPYFFQPLRLRTKGQHHLMIDGGVLSNYPVWLFDSKEKPRWPTFGFRLVSDHRQKRQLTGNFWQYTQALLKTMISAVDHLAVREADAVRTIFIPTGHTSATDFSLTPDEKEALYRAGEKAAEEFFCRWDFEAYCLKYRRRYKMHGKNL